MKKIDTQQKKILIVEDEEALATALEYNLLEENYNVTVARDGQIALDYIEKNEYDLIILDIMLPYFNGFEIAQNVREKNLQLPILILSAKAEIKDRLQGLELGADDYMTKPFHLGELLLRIKGMLKRKAWYKKSSMDQPTYQIGDTLIHFENLTCKSEKSEIQLTPREGMVLKYLIENKGKIISRKELLENVWNISSEVETRTIDNFIARLRKYIENDPKHPIHIKSVRSAGYLFED